MNLEKYLEVAKLTQAEFGDLVDVSQARIGQLLSGQSPSLKLAQRIAAKTQGAVPLSAWAPVGKKKAA